MAGCLWCGCSFHPAQVPTHHPSLQGCLPHWAWAPALVPDHLHPGCPSLLGPRLPAQGSPLHTVLILCGLHHSALDQRSYRSPLYSFFTLRPLMALGISCSERKGREGKGRERKERGRGAATLTNLFFLSLFLLSVFLSFLPSFLCSQNRETS